jgi:phenylacetate-CoA ligase
LTCSGLTDLSVVSPVFGGPRESVFFASPGPIYELEGAGEDYWRLARPLFAAGFRAGDLVHNCFSYHFTPAGSMLETGAHALGCPVFPGGVGQTDHQLQAMLDLAPDGYVGSPSFLKIILEKADEQGIKLAPTWAQLRTSRPRAKV